MFKKIKEQYNFETIIFAFLISFNYDLKEAAIELFWFKIIHFCFLSLII